MDRKQVEEPKSLQNTAKDYTIQTYQDKPVKSFLQMV